MSDETIPQKEEILNKDIPADSTTTTLHEEKATSTPIPPTDKPESTDISTKDAELASAENHDSNTNNDADLEKAKPSPPEEDMSGYPKGFKLASVILALCLAVFLVALDQTIIATAIPKITDQFHSISDIGWYGSAYFLTGTSLQPSFGRIYQVFNVRTVFLIAIGVFELGSLVCATAPSSKALIIGRAVAGLGVGGIFSGALVIIAHTLPLAKRPMVFGAFGGMWGLASIAGPLLGGVFTDHLSWRWCFYINLPIGGFSVAVIVLFFRLKRDPKDSEKPIMERILELDLIGAGILIPAIIMLLLAVQWGGNTYPWKSGHIIGLFVGAGLMLILFVCSQIYLGDKATLPPRIMKQRTVAAVCAYVFFFGGGVFLLMYYLPLYLQAVKGSSPTKSGIQILPFMLSAVIMSIFAGAFATIVGKYTALLIASAALMTVGAGLITTLGADAPFGHWFGYQIIAGLGSGVGFNIPLVAVQTVLSMEDIPIGSVAVIFFQTLGGALWIAIGQSLFANGFIEGLAKFAPQLDEHTMINTGATAIRSTLEKLGQTEYLPGALMAYVNGLDNTYRAVTAAYCAATLAACFVEWRSVKKPEEGEVAVPAMG